MSADPVRSTREPSPDRAPGRASDRDVAALKRLADLIVANARSPRQRERVVSAARLPLTAAGLTALREIARHEPVPATDLARRLGIDLSTVSRQLKPLDDHDLVTRTTEDADRRVSWLRITEAGRDVLRRADEVMINDFGVALADWTETDREMLGDLLERLVVSLRSVRTDETGWSVAKEAHTVTVTETETP
jgi:DNA-binding MarR family transcriptional regulator